MVLKPSVLRFCNVWKFIFTLLIHFLLNCEKLTVVLVGRASVGGTKPGTDTSCRLHLSVMDCRTVDTVCLWQMCQKQEGRGPVYISLD